jgi:hypothetical protein
MNAQDPNLPPAMEPSGPPPFTQEFQSLEEASRGLSGDVQALNAALEVVNRLQVEQRDQRAKTADNAREIERARELSEKRNTHYNRIVTAGSAGAVVLLAIVAVLIYVATLHHVNHLLAEQQLARYQSCQIRNQGTESNIAREQQLAKLDTTAALRNLHATSAIELQKSQIDCNAYKP